MAVVFETERLNIETFKPNDSAFWKVLHTLPDIIIFTADKSTDDEAELQKKIIDNKRRKLTRWKVMLKNNSTPIGLCGFKKHGKEFHLGFRLLKRFRKKGFATEAASTCIDYAFRNTGLKKISAYSMPDNKASIKVLKKCNFSFVERYFENKIEWLRFELRKSDWNK